MMPGGRRYGGIIMGDNGISSSANALEALLSSPVFHGSRSLANLEDVIGNVSKRPFCNTLDAEETGDEDLDDCIHPPEKKRRLTSEQVQFLEKSFEIENKLEPERKIRLARDLGLQPRQVAVWFQNRRARWKTKQLERDYGLLKSSYDNLSVEYDSLLKEKEKLRTEVILLIDKLHAKDKDLQIQTNDTDTIDKQSSLQAVAKFEGFEKSEMATSIKDPQMSFKHEDLLSSGTDSSGVVDEDSPRRIDCSHSSVVDHVASSHNFEPDQSDLSHVEEEEEEEEGISGKLLPQTYNLLKLEDGIYPDASAGSCNYMLAMEDQVHLPWNFCWDWPYLA